MAMCIYVDWAALDDSTRTEEPRGSAKVQERDKEEPAEGGVSGRLHTGEDQRAAFSGRPPPRQRRRRHDPGRDLQLLQPPGGPPAVRVRGAQHRAGGAHRALRRPHRQRRLHDGGATQHERAGEREPDPQAHQRHRLRGAVLQGHRHHHLALPRRLSHREGGRRRVSGARCRKAQGGGRFHV